MKMAILEKISFRFWSWHYKFFLFFKCERSSNREILNYDCLYGNYNFPDNINLTSICTHKSHDLHNVISNLYHFDYKNIGFISYIWKYLIPNWELKHLTIRHCWEFVSNCINSSILTFLTLEQIIFQQTNMISRSQKMNSDTIFFEIKIATFLISPMPAQAYYSHS
jgi:hypothetical protein